ncbi:Hypothetical predicted protein [Octopus vulgaris]|uniref:Uncharacterized protein n=1 Tax=Octopus vulgaris TaxID=6645 RepID=A0AA36F2C0_OCTVU|nr:Hypothetical predicted protein [Octopus vulgaris]
MNKQQQQPTIIIKIIAIKDMRRESLIPPKLVKRANIIEGSEQFDGIEEKVVESESEDESETSGNFLEVIDPSGEIPMEVSQEPKHGRPNMMTGSSISILGISSVDQVHKDALFLEKMRVLDENNTATHFLPHQSKFMSTVSEARRSVKKRISKPRNLQKDNDEES